MASETWNDQAIIKMMTIIFIMDETKSTRMAHIDGSVGGCSLQVDVPVFHVQRQCAKSSQGTSLGAYFMRKGSRRGSGTGWR